MKRGKWWIVSALIFCVLFGLWWLWWEVPTYRKARADVVVRELCAKDGGLKVYETIKLPADRFNQFGEIRVLHERHHKSNDDEFFYTTEDTWITRDKESIVELVIWRGQIKLFRTVDNKLLGEAVYYARRGGDPIGPWHVSSLSCPEKSDIKYLAQRVFVKQ